MSKVDRRDFLKTTTAVAAAASLPLSEQANASPPLVGVDQPVPPQRVQILYGLHAYTDKLSVEPGEEIQFLATSTVPYKLSVCRLGEEVDDPSSDQVFVEFPESPPRRYCLFFLYFRFCFLTLYSVCRDFSQAF